MLDIVLDYLNFDLRHEEVFWRSCLGKEVYINVYTYTHIYLCEKLFTKNTIFELVISIPSSFSGMPFNTFWKRAPHICLHDI